MQSDNNKKHALEDLARDLSKMVGSAAGVAFNATREAEQWMKLQIEALLTKMNIVTREEFEVAKSMAAKAREENATLAKRIAELERKLSGKSAKAPAAAKAKKSAVKKPTAKKRKK
ncbi:MAG: accessory factor UbiK family protein [Proteobacteria bacterium]|nr:accessory factor UbiK family protein [Pseudomonadota bacterium]